MNLTNKYSLLILPGLLFTFCFFSCNKKDTSPQSSIIHPGYNVSYPDTLISASFPNSPEIYAFDVDNDSVNDYEIMCVQNHMVCVYTYNETQISCLNKDAFLVTDSIRDTTFVDIKLDTTYADGKKEITIKKQFSPKRIDKDDSIIDINQLHYVVPFRGDNLLTYRNCTSGTYKLTRENYWIMYWYYETGPDWQLHVDNYYLYPELFPDNQASYIGIKKMVKGKEKTGWIKLLLLNQKTISVLEVAIQK